MLRCYQCGNNIQEYFYHPEGWLNLVATCSCRARGCRIIREDPAVSGPDVPVEEKWGLKCTGSEANPGEMRPGIRHAESQAQDSVLLNTWSQQKFFPVKNLLNNATSIILSEASYRISVFIGHKPVTFLQKRVYLCVKSYMHPIINNKHLILINHTRGKTDLSFCSHSI